MSKPFKICEIIISIIYSLLCLIACKEEKEEIEATRPIVITTAVIEVNPPFATIKGDVTSDGGSPIISRGICWGTSEEASISNDTTKEIGGLGIFTSTIHSLTASSKYYVRAYATNRVGTGYGGLISFTAKYPVIFNPNLNYGTVTDIEGNEYKTITIGTQVWTAENLRTTKYNDKTPIPLVTDNTAWIELSSPAYCWAHNNEESYKFPYGAIYNGYAVTTGKLCPTGWHVPTDAEWTVLIDYLGGANVAGGNLKETGTTHWNDPNEGATNISGFTALPGGGRNSWNGGFSSIGGSCGWHSSTEIRTDYILSRGVLFILSTISTNDEYSGNKKQSGLFVRCLKD